jgi:hypothetical protein
MAQTKDPSSSPPSPASSSSSSSISWLSYTSAQAQELGAGVAESSDAVLRSTRSYLTGIASSTSQFIPQVLAPLLEPAFYRAMPVDSSRSCAFLCRTQPQKDHLQRAARFETRISSLDPSTA